MKANPASLRTMAKPLARCSASPGFHVCRTTDAHRELCLMGIKRLFRFLFRCVAPAAHSQRRSGPDLPSSCHTVLCFTSFGGGRKSFLVALCQVLLVSEETTTLQTVAA